MNTRIQVEHTVTEMVTGVDLVQAQIRVAEGYQLHDPQTRVPAPKDLRLKGYAIQARITTENPAKNFTPDYGRITTYRSAAGFGIRLDGGTAFTGAVITPYYDSLLVKTTSHGSDFLEAAARLNRALSEFTRFRGLSSNIPFFQNVLRHPDFLAGKCDTGFIEAHPGTFHLERTARPRQQAAEFPRRNHRQRQPNRRRRFEEAGQSADSSCAAYVTNLDTAGGCWVFARPEFQTARARFY